MCLGDRGLVLSPVISSHSKEQNQHNQIQITERKQLAAWKLFYEDWLNK